MKLKKSKQENKKLCFIFSILFLFAITTINISLADIYITEVLYDPSITESGGEAIELYNSDNIPINISGFTIKTQTSEIDATLPSNAFISAQGYYLITDIGWDTNKDSISFPRADYEEAITMKNSDSGIILKDNDGNIIDIVGWGNPLLGFYINEPAEMTNETHSLQRIDYTGNNKIDFISAYPNLMNSEENIQDLSGNIFSIKVHIPSTTDYILNFTVETDSGNEIYLMPGEQKAVKIYFEVNKKFTKSNITLNYDSMPLDFTENTMSDNSILYSSTLNLNYYTLKGNHSLDLKLNDSNNIYASTINFSIASIMAFEIDSTEFECSLLESNECQMLGDIDTSTSSKPTIKNIGNVPLDFKIFSDSSLENNLSIKYLPDEIIEFSFDNINYTKLSQERKLFNINLQPGINAKVPFSVILADLSNYEAGEYNKQFVIMGIEHE